VAAVRASVEEMLTHLKQQLARTEKLTRKHIDKHPSLKQQSELLTSIPGIAQTTAALLLAEVPNIKQYRSARQVAAFAGLVPRERQSGSSLKGRVRLSKIGNSRLRKALYFPAITALRCSEFFQQWANCVRQRGKTKMSVIGAVMRKLIHIAYGVLKSGQPFDPNHAQSA
jgi:transposase